MERKAGRGEWTGGGLPFGYRIDSERRFLCPEPTEAPVVAQVFRSYAERLEGSAQIARWLTGRGYRTERGKPFNVPAVLTILRNRAYLGEVHFRGRHYPAPHEPLVDVALFDRAAEILRERGEDASLRRSNQSNYLLTGLVKCARCGKRYGGAAAHGNGGRCLLRLLLAPTLRPEGVRGRSPSAGELAVDADEAPEPLGEEELRALQAHVREVLETGDPPARKALLQALVEEIRFVSRAEIYPSFSLPAVRPPSGSARPAGFEPATSRSGGARSIH